jgi:hypothetical protein
MPTKYIFRCPNQSYAISLPMCQARQNKNLPKCAHCKNKPEGAATCQQQRVMRG